MTEEFKMEKMKHSLMLEESISRYINILELEFGIKLTNNDKEWIYSRSEELFETYYVNKKLSVDVSTKNDDVILTNYLEYLHSIMNKMFSHILMIEFRLYLSSRYKEE